MNRTEVANELELVARLLNADGVNDPMAAERLPRLYLALETWVTKKVSTLPSSAPVAAQLVGSLVAVRDELKDKHGLTGREAVEAMLSAMKRGGFTTHAPPVPALTRKYGVQIQNFIRGW